MSKAINILLEGEGTYHTCEVCPKDKNCCAGAHENTVIGSPFLFTQEIARVEQYLNTDRNTFLESATDNSDDLNIAFIKNSGAGCYFYQDYQCIIYPVRPFICALFPFEPAEIDGKMHWIFYTELCPIKFDYTQHFENVKQVLKKSGISREDYLRSLETVPVISSPYIVLEEAEFP